MLQVNPLLGRIFHMRNQALFSLKYKSKKIKMPSAAILFGALRVNSNRVCAFTEIEGVLVA